MLTRTWQIFVIWLVLAQPAYALQWGNTGTDYPNTIDTANQRTNKGGGSCSSATTTNICKEWLNDWQNADIAVQTELGTNPSGSYGTVKDRLDALANGSGLSTGVALPSPVISSKVQLPRVTALPGSPTAGDTVIITDDSSVGACDSAAGSAQSLCQYNGSAWTSLGDGGGGGAPTDAGYWVDQANGSLSAERNLGGLTTGLVLNTVTAGVGVPSAYAGASCTNQFLRSLNASGAGTCATVGDADVADTITVSNYLPLAGGTMAGPIGLADQYASSGGNPADTGVYRLSNNEKLCWELATPGTDLCFYIGTDDEFHFDAPVNVGGTGGPVQLTEAAVGDPGTAGKANLGVNTSHMLQWYGNGGSLRTAAYGTTTGVPIGDDTAYGAGWNGSTNTPTQNAVYDKVSTIPLLTAATATVATDQSTTSTTFTDLTTSGPSVTLTVGSGGVAEVTVCARMWNTGSYEYEGFMDVALSGGNTRSASDTTALVLNIAAGVDNAARACATNLFTSLSAASTTFTAKYRAEAGTGHFQDRSIIVKTW